MKIGLIVATIEEFSSVLKIMNLKEEVIEDDVFTIYYININNNDIYISKSGVGEIASSSLTQYLITKYNVKLIINAGVVGSLKNHFSLEQVCLVKDVVHYDFDTSKIDNHPVGYYEDYGRFIPLTNKYIELIKNNYPDILEVRCASGDKFIDSKEMKDYLVKEFDADICDMESAGITLTAIKNKVDLISLKIVSDDGDASKYNSNVNKTCDILYQLLNKLLVNI